MKLLNNRCPVASLTFALCALLFALSHSAEAQQQPKKIPRIGYLSVYDKASEATRAAGIRLA
ncbi:MAG TPA: hypothetical protein VF452_17075, partial [Candidatus Binatia bacterium]